MKPRHVWLLLAAVFLAVFAGWLARHRATPAAPVARPEVAIQDGKTLDFSSGQPVVKDSAAEKAIIDDAVKEMREAAKDVTFPPLAAPPAKTDPASTPTVQPSKK